MTDQEAVALARAELLGAAMTLEAAADSCSGLAAQAAKLIAMCIRAGDKVLLCGNGGSAADCQHLAAEFVSALRRDVVRPAIPALALTTDTSILTASANDFGFAGVFARQVEALAKPGDILLGLSTSGGSPNVICAMETARAMGLGTIALTGPAGGAVAELATVAIKVPAVGVQHIQEAHIAIGHAICLLVEMSLYPHPAAGMA